MRTNRTYLNGFKSLMIIIILNEQSNSSIWHIDETIASTTTPGQSGPGSNGNERVLPIFSTIWTCVCVFTFMHVYIYIYIYIYIYCNPLTDCFDVSQLLSEARERERERERERVVIVSVVGNGHGDPRSNPGRVCYISRSTYTLWKGVNPTIISLLRINSMT